MGMQSNVYTLDHLYKSIWAARLGKRLVFELMSDGGKLESI